MPKLKYLSLFSREEVARELKSALSHIKLAATGVYVQASTLGSLEALLEFLRTSKIPVSDCVLFTTVCLKVCNTFVINYVVGVMKLCVVVRLSSLTVWWEFEVKNADVVECLNRILGASN